MPYILYLLFSVWLKKSHKQDLQQLSDAELTRLCQASNNELYVAELFLRYSEKVYIITRRYIEDRENAKDVAMMIFEDLLIKFPNTELQSFSNWLHKVTVNKCLSYLRTETNHLRLLNQWSEAEKKVENSVENDPLIRLINEEHNELLKTALDDAFSQLKEEQKVCIQLFYYEKKSYKEIADVMDFSENAVKTNLQNGKKNLLKILS